jgi:predicted lipoprotein with Yx(FWY)xxD motif
MAFRTWVAARSRRYTLYTDNWGCYTLVRNKDGESLFFQQGDPVRDSGADKVTGRITLDRFASEYEGTVTWYPPLQVSSGTI